MRDKTRSRKTGLVLAAGVLGALAVAAPAMAASHYESKEGGYWSWGTWDSKNHSNYYHYLKKHRSSVHNYQYGWNKSPCTAATSWSYAIENEGPTDNEAFYAFCS